MNEGIVNKDAVLWKLALGYSVGYSSIMESTQSRSNSVALAVSYFAPEYYTGENAQW